MRIQLRKRIAVQTLHNARYGRNFGFTLIELMIVMTIILILIGMAAIRYDKVVQHIPKRRY